MCNELLPQLGFLSANHYNLSRWEFQGTASPLQIKFQASIFFSIIPPGKGIQIMNVIEAMME